MRRCYNKVELSAAQAQELFGSMRAKFRAARKRATAIHFPEEGRRNDATRNVWNIGWDPASKSWVASNNRTGWRFRDYGALYRFKTAMGGPWNWEVTAV